MYKQHAFIPIIDKKISSFGRLLVETLITLLVYLFLGHSLYFWAQLRRTVFRQQRLNSKKSEMEYKLETINIYCF